VPVQEKIDANGAGKNGQAPPRVGEQRQLPEADFMRSLFEDMPALGWSARADGSIDHYNRRWHEFARAAPTEMQDWAVTSVHDVQSLPAVVEQWKHALSTGDPFEATLQLRRHDGVSRWFLLRANPMRGADGRVLRWIGVCVDIDERKRAEEAAARSVLGSEDAARQRLEDAVSVHEDLLATVSHDLRNPLSTVLMAANQVELLADQGALDPSAKKPARIIAKAVEQMTRLVSDLLDLSKLKAGQPLPLHLERHDAVELIHESLEQFEAVAKMHRLDLTTTAAAPIHVLCDRDRIQQVLSNLLGNAMKFTGGGGELSVHAQAAAGEVIFSVKDTGIGISDERITHIFDAYWQFDSQQKRGAGLGLSISKAIVVAHGGRIWVDSAVGAGSIFHFALPDLDHSTAS
jgi:PAS domain S-box-containing protein